MTFQRKMSGARSMVKKPSELPDLDAADEGLPAAGMSFKRP